MRRPDRDRRAERRRRDVMISLYFFLSWDIPEGTHPLLTLRHKRWFPGLRDKLDVAANLPAFIAQNLSTWHRAYGMGPRELAQVWLAVRTPRRDESRLN